MAIQKEIWQRTIIEGLFADNTFAGKAVNDDAYVNQGKTVHIPNAGSPSKVVINRTTIPASASERTDADVDYSLDELTTDPVHIPHADTVELSYDKRNSVISQDRQKLIEEASQNLLYKWNPGSTNFVRTTGGAVAAHTASATGNRKALTKADILSLMTKFNADNVPMSDRYILLDAQMYAQLLRDLTETEAIGFFRRRMCRGASWARSTASASCSAPRCCATPRPGLCPSSLRPERRRTMPQGWHGSSAR